MECRIYSQDNAVIAEKEEQAIALLKLYYAHYEDKKLDSLSDAERSLENWIDRFYASVRIRIPIRQISTSSIEANYYLGRIFEEGKCVSIDAERALNHYRCAAASNIEACYRMGYIYEFGVGSIGRNNALARECYQQAADRGYELAAKRLTLSYSFFSLFTDASDFALIEETKKDNCLVM